MTSSKGFSRARQSGKWKTNQGKDRTVGKHCVESKPQPVLMIDKCEVWGGRESQIMPIADQFECIISLLGAVRRTEGKFTLTRGSRRMFRHLSAYQQRRNNVICIDWPDMQAPKLDKGFWEALAQDLGGITGKAAIFCMGGHGRTGTALCALAHVTKYAPAITDGDVVAWLRETYCEHAVETESQVSYLTRVVGAKTKAGIRKKAGYWGGSNAVSSMFRETGGTERGQLDDEEYWRGMERP